jgi:hypothetical protein
VSHNLPNLVIRGEKKDKKQKKKKKNKNEKHFLTKNPNTICNPNVAYLRKKPPFLISAFLFYFIVGWGW